MDLLLIGPPGVGKGTQAALLAARAGLTHLASGDLFRANIQAATPLGVRAKAFVERGELVPDDLVSAMVLDSVLAHDAVLLDGFPRTLGQARELDERLAGVGRRVDSALLLTAPRRDLLRRIVGRQACAVCHAPYNTYFQPSRVDHVCDLCGTPLSRRADDTVETAEHRLAVYERQTRPLADYYTQRGVLRAVDGAGDPSDVADRIAAALPEALLRSAS